MNFSQGLLFNNSASTVARYKKYDIFCHRVDSILKKKKKKTGNIRFFHKFSRVKERRQRPLKNLFCTKSFIVHSEKFRPTYIYYDISKKMEEIYISSLSWTSKKKIPQLTRQPQFSSSLTVPGGDKFPLNSLRVFRLFPRCTVVKTEETKRVRA